MPDQKELFPEKDVHKKNPFRNTKFHGPSFDKDKDQVRLSANVLKIFNLMKDGRRVTKRDLVRVCPPGTSDETASRAMRSLRAPENGEHIIHTYRVNDSGLHEYSLEINPDWKGPR